MRTAFLHIPKTAGQSIHDSLVALHDPEEICPARTNQQLHAYSIKELIRFKLFSGHLDWSILRSTGKFDFVFTVLREPTERILSFYFYLRGEAQRMRAAGMEIGLGMQAVLDWSAKDYFTAGDPATRQFLDNHYNNFYAYYFASGCYSGFRQLSKHFPPASPELRDYALNGLRTLDGVYDVTNLTRLSDDLAGLYKTPIKPFAELNVNRQVGRSDRQDELTALAGDWDWRATIREFTVCDDEIFRRVV